MSRKQYTYDDLLELKAAGLVAATAAGSLIVDLGDAYCEGDVVIDVSAVEVATGDEKYTVVLEGSNASDMSSGSVVLASKSFGNATAPMDSAVSTSGRYVLPFTNDVLGTTYQYVRIHTTVAGTVATGMNYSAFVGKK